VTLCAAYGSAPPPFSPPFYSKRFPFFFFFFPPPLLSASECTMGSAPLTTPYRCSRSLPPSISFYFSWSSPHHPSPCARALLLSLKCNASLPSPFPCLPPLCFSRTGPAQTYCCRCSFFMLCHIFPSLFFTLAFHSQGFLMIS